MGLVWTKCSAHGWACASVTRDMEQCTAHLELISIRCHPSVAYIFIYYSVLCSYPHTHMHTINTLCIFHPYDPHKEVHFFLWKKHIEMIKIQNRIPFKRFSSLNVRAWKMLLRWRPWRNGRGFVWLLWGQTREWVTKYIAWMSGG